MRLLELEVTNVRGIRSTLKLKPDGKNIAVWGPNGSGKSAVVDAIDFLLTGRIARLTGRGTAGISLALHGHHIEAETSEAYVRALVALPGIEGTVELRRRMDTPMQLECEPDVRDQLQPFLELAARGQHVLTRRELLKYVVTEAGVRAQEIQGLLNLTAVETTRQALVSVKTRSRQKAEHEAQAVREAQARLSVILGTPSYDRERTLNAVNQHRAVLGGGPIGAAEHGTLKDGLLPPTAGRSDRPELAEGRAAIQSLRSLLSPGTREARVRSNAELQDLLSVFRSDPSLERAIHHRQLLELGAGLIDSTGTCPLCEQKWEQDELRTRIEARLNEAHTAVGQSSRISQLAADLQADVATCRRALESLIDVARFVDRTELLPAIQAWIGDVNRFELELADPLHRYPASGERIADLHAPPAAPVFLAQMDSDLESSLSNTPPQQASWDKLTQLDEALLRAEMAGAGLQDARGVELRASKLSEAYEASRNEILDGLYTEVRDRFVTLYRQLHGSHEASFTADLAPEGAGLEFRVDFLGHGKHPPQALHSEGHQDSMGICLYLALAERLTAGLIDLTILDDVMMSVDADHRRELCRLLASAFPDRQLFITTHDRTWANQLRTEGVVTAANCIQFFGWDVATGPRIVVTEGLWDSIDGDLARGDVPGAAHKLRRGSEAYFGDVCDAIWAPVRYRLNGRTELGDLIPAAMARLRSLLKLAKASANSWGRLEVLEELSEIQSVSAQIFSRTQAEQWAVNDNVHYNGWADFVVSDFQPVVEAFADLFDVFRCVSCATLLRVTTEGGRPSGVKCACGAKTWGLELAS